jgi:hypothetical protein
MSHIEAKVLSDTYQKTRDLTRWYFSLLKEVDPYLHWEVNGVKLNNLIWLGSHITWAENFLLLKGTGGRPLDIDWLEHYNISSSGTIHHADHNMKTILDSLKMVHEEAMKHLLTISDEKMEMENSLGFGFGGLKTNRVLVQHAIRHEAMHTGHLSWLCKINKIESV